MLEGNEKESDYRRGGSVWGRTTENLKVHKHEICFNTFYAETESLWSQSIENHIRFGRDNRLLNISAYAQGAIK